MNEIYLSKIIISFIYIWILKAYSSIQLKIFEDETIYHLPDGKVDKPGMWNQR